MHHKTDCIIIGAGISGLVLAHRLESAGHTVLLLEKSRGVGGRMATRRDGAATYDHGAQFYKISDKTAWELDDLWSGANLSETWFKKENSVFKCASGGMTRLAKHLAGNLKIVLEEKVISISNNSDIHCESGRTYLGKNIYITSPLPQTLDILRTSQIEYPKNLEAIHYANALVGLFEVESTSETLENIKYLQNVNSDIFSISNQLSKKVSLTLAYTVVMQPDWSMKNFDNTDVASLQKVTDAFSRYLKSVDSSFTIKKQQLKKWRFSHPTSQHSTPYVAVGPFKNIFLLGDAFGGPSLRGAVHSAEAIPTTL
jgi:predicted NAD/FAD-dependent oxidoreductase